MKIWMTCEALTEECAPNVTLLEIRNSLRKQNHSVLLFCPATERKYLSPGDSDVCFVPTLNLRWLKEMLYQFLLAFSMLFFSMKSRPDWIYTRPVLIMVVPALVAKLIRIPHVLHLSGDLLDQLRGAKRSPFVIAGYRVIEKINCKLSHRIVVESHNNKMNYQKRHHLTADRVIVIPNGANTQLFRPRDIAEARQEIGVERDCLCVGFVGNLGERGGVPCLLKAASMIVQEIPRSRFLIVGDGPMREALMEIAQNCSASDKITFFGSVPWETVPTYIASMDVCVVPLSRARFEKVGISSLKLREYLACGRPVVGSDIDGIGDLLREANAGIAVTPENTPEFAQAIIRLLRDKALRDKMGENGRKFALENLDWEKAARKLTEIWETAVADSGKSSCPNDARTSG